MERRAINPWRWQAQFGFVQAAEVTVGQRVLYCAGQASIDEDGRPVDAGDMRAQVGRALDNLETVLHAAGFEPADLVRLNYYTTDVELLFRHWDVVANRLAAAGARVASTLLGVARLAFPELLVEIEGTAVK